MKPPTVVPPRPGQQVHPGRVGAGGEHEQQPEQRAGPDEPAQPAERADADHTEQHRGGQGPLGPGLDRRRVRQPAVVRQADQLEQRPPGGQVGRPVERLAAGAAQRAAQLGQQQHRRTQPGRGDHHQVPAQQRRARDPPLGQRGQHEQHRGEQQARVQADQADQPHREQQAGAQPGGPGAGVEQVQQQHHDQRQQHRAGGERQQRPAPQQVVERGHGDRAGRGGHGEHGPAAEPVHQGDDGQRAHAGQQHGVRVQHGGHVDAGQSEHDRGHQVVGVGVEDLDALSNQLIDPIPTRLLSPVSAILADAVGVEGGIPVLRVSRTAGRYRSRRHRRRTPRSPPEPRRPAGGSSGASPVPPPASSAAATTMMMMTTTTATATIRPIRWPPTGRRPGPGPTPAPAARRRPVTRRRRRRRTAARPARPARRSPVVRRRPASTRAVRPTGPGPARAARAPARTARRPRAPHRTHR